MNSDYLKFENEAMRREILAILEEDPDYAVGDEIVQKCLAMRGIQTSNDRLLAQLDWLKEQQLIDTEHLGTMIQAKLSRRGEDVALGRTTVPGIAKKRPQ